MTLTDFLLARIAEDEDGVDDWPTEGEWGLHSPGLMWVDTFNRPIYAPRAKVLAECEAKRRIVDEARAWQVYAGHAAARVSMYACQALALPYADHPDYREEWKP